MEIKMIKNKFDLAKVEYDVENIVDFLYQHLDEFGDKKSAIRKCIDYSFSQVDGKGGFILLGVKDDRIITAVIMNYTGMAEFIPKYYLVYVATHAEERGNGYGTEIIEKAISEAGGDVALHVEYENPAKGLYEHLGFTSKYAEMRYNKDKG